MEDLQLFCIKMGNALWSPEKGSPYFKNKVDAKVVRNKLNAITIGGHIKDSGKYHISRGPDHWKSK